MKTISRILPTSLLTLIILFLNSSFVLSQKNSANCSTTVADSSIFEENMLGEFPGIIESNKNAVFYNPDWRMGTIVLENNKIITNKYLNYHQLNGQLYWIRTPDYRQIILNKEKVKEIIIYAKDNSKEEVFRKIIFTPWYKPSSISEYLQVLAEGKINLYAYRRVEMNVSNNETVHFTDYYIQINQKNIEHLKRGRWALYANVGDYKTLMKKIVRGNHLSIRHEDDLIRAIDLFNVEVKKVTN
jgi:hypothetical protein